MRLPRPSLAFGSAAALSLMLTGCTGPTASGSAELSIVTSTNVYADIISQVAGDTAKVTAIIDDPNQDPHAYEATTRDRLRLSKADLVVINGGGYDSFMTTMLEASDAKPEVIDVAAISGLPGSEDAGADAHGDDHSHEGDHEGAADDHAGHDHGEFNEHLWYSVPTMGRLVDDVADHLGEAMPEQKAKITADAKTYKGELAGLEETIGTVKAEHGGEKVATTEPVPLWLFDDMGLKNITSPEFLAAVEEGNDVPPLALRDADAQISSGDAVLLAYNTQAAGPQAEQLRATAEASGVPVVDLAETMPADELYTKWMGGSIDRIATALKGHAH